MKRFFTSSACLLAVAITAYAGGWSTLTFEDLPDNFVVGEPARVTFVVRGHGVGPADYLQPEVYAVSGRLKVNAVVRKAKKKGGYTFTLTLPKPGDWTLEIKSGYSATSHNALKVNAINPGTVAPPMSLAARGERLFETKACAVCHSGNLGIAPDLTGRKFPPEYLSKFLDDPQATRGRSGLLEYGDMPDLGLSAAEIEALIAFINR